MKTFVAAFLLLTSCAGLKQHVHIAPDSKRSHCYELADAQRLWSALAGGSSAFAAGGGFSAIPVKDDEARAVVLVSAAAIAAFATAANIVADDYLDEYGRECEDLGDVGIAEFPTTTSTGAVELHF